MLAKRSSAGGGDPFSTPRSSVKLQDQKMIDKLTKSDRPYKFNMNEFFKNAKDCDGGELDISIPGYDAGDKLPKCFVNLEVKKASQSPFYQN